MDLAVTSAWEMRSRGDSTGFASFQFSIFKSSLRFVMPRSASGRVEQQMQAVRIIKKDKPLEPRAEIQFAMTQISGPEKLSRGLVSFKSIVAVSRCQLLLVCSTLRLSWTARR